MLTERITLRTKPDGKACLAAYLVSICAQPAHSSRQVKLQHNAWNGYTAFAATRNFNPDKLCILQHHRLGPPSIFVCCKRIMQRCAHARHLVFSEQAKCPIHHTHWHLQDISLVCTAVPQMLVWRA